MNTRRNVSLVILLVLFCFTELAWGQFQRMLIPPQLRGRGRGRISAVPARIHLAAACLDHGVRTPTEADVFASVSAGHAFLIGGLAGGERERVDLSEAVDRGWVVLRGTGKNNEVLAEVLLPGWTELEILAGLQALPRGIEEVELPQATLKLLEEATEAEATFARMPEDAGALCGRILAAARQQHLWMIHSPSWQALRTGSDPLDVALHQFSRQRHDPTTVDRLEWVLRRRFNAEELQTFTSGEAEPFTGSASPSSTGLCADFGILRLVETPGRKPSSFEVVTREGTESVALTHTGLRELKPLLEHCPAGQVILTHELLGALRQAGLETAFDLALANAGHPVAQHVPDDDLLLQSYEAGPAVRRRFVVIAPATREQAKTLFGDSSRAAFAFRDLIDAGVVERIESTDDLQALAARRRAGEQLVLVCMQQSGRIPLPDGSRMSMADLPIGVSEVIACDALHPSERALFEMAQPGAFTFDALAAALDATASTAGNLPMTRAALLESLSAGLVKHWKRHRVKTGPVLKWSRTLSGDAVAIGAGGTVLKVSAAVSTPRMESLSADRSSASRG